MSTPDLASPPAALAGAADDGSPLDDDLGVDLRGAEAGFRFLAGASSSSLSPMTLSSSSLSDSDSEGDCHLLFYFFKRQRQCRYVGSG